MANEPEQLDEDTERRYFSGDCILIAEKYAAGYLTPEQLSPVLDKLLCGFTQEDLEYQKSLIKDHREKNGE